MTQARLTVMSFNLRYLNEQDGENHWSNRLDKVVKMIHNHRPDLIGTQEVLPSMLDDLTAALPEYAWIGRGRDNEDGDGEHCAIFYKKDLAEVLEQGQFWLSETPETAGVAGWDARLPRICTWAQFKGKDGTDLSGRTFLFYNTHLDHVGKLAKEESAKLIWKQMKEQWQHTSIPVMLTGDFNSHPDTMPIQYLDERSFDEDNALRLVNAYEVIDGPVGATAHGFKGIMEASSIKGKPIDYIYVSSDLQVIETEVDRSRIGGGYPSDHYPVVTHLQLLND